MFLYDADADDDDDETRTNERLIERYVYSHSSHSIERGERTRVGWVGGIHRRRDAFERGNAERVGGTYAARDARDVVCMRLYACT